MGGLPGERGSAGGVWAGYLYSDSWSDDSNLPAVPKNPPNVSGGFWGFPRFDQGGKFLFLATPGHSQHGRADEYPPVPGNPSCVSNLLRSTSLCPIRLADHFPSHTPPVGRTLPKGKKKATHFCKNVFSSTSSPSFPCTPTFFSGSSPTISGPFSTTSISKSPLSSPTPASFSLFLSDA